jgi:glycosyltransferase involved in cell wall biosynthesis
MYRLGMSLSDAVVANSRAGLAAFGLVEGDRGHVVYNGFDSARLANVTAPDTDAAPHKARVSIMAARMFPGKDWRLLIDAARVLARDDDGWRFVAIGNGPERDTLMSEAADLMQQRVVDFPEGGLEALPLIATADIGLLLTNPAVHAEGCSNSIMEYMACGLPVVCTDSGGNPEIVANGVSGLLVAPRDVSALVSALRTLGSNPSLARQFGREGRRQIEAHFTVEAMVARYVAIYESLLGPRS